MTRLRIGFLIDPIETLIVGHDTSLAFMLECQRRGHEVHYFEQKHLGYRDGNVYAGAKRVELQRVKGDHYRVVEEARLELSVLDVIFLRKDPPVDVEYLHATQLLELASGPLLVNDPGGLRDANEKLYVLRYPDLIPKTLVSRSLAELRVFLEELGGEVVMATTDGTYVYTAGGNGNNAHTYRYDPATNLWDDPAIPDLPASREGDKRIVLVDGEPLGAMMRIPQAGDVRGNLAAGGRSAKSALTAREREICRRLAADLRRRGLYFVGLDVIGGFLTEVNVTSPTGIEEINAFDEIAIERAMIDFVERKIEERHRAARA